MKRIYLLITLATSCFFLSRATDYYVDATTGSNATGDGTSSNPWQTITYALDQITGTGHTLYVAAGTYDPTLGENFPILMKNGVSLVGAGIDISIIDANGTNTVIRCVSILDSTTNIEGFTIQNGYNTTSSGGGVCISAGSVLKIVKNKITDNYTDVSCDGGGICVINSSPKIVNNIISENSSGQANGGGIYIENGSPLIMGNNIVSNSSDYDGAVYICGSSSSPIIVRNIISMNTQGGIECNEAGNPRITNNTIFGNTGRGGDYGYGIYLFSSSPDIINNTISDNLKEGIYIYSGTPDSILNNILSLNGGYGIYENGTTNDPGKVWYNLFYANSSGLYYDEGSTDYYTASSLNSGVTECENNIDGDPLFVDRVNGDYRIRLGSPAIDSGDPDPQFNDPDGSRNDIGAFAFDKPPAAPQNLSATAGAGKITLRWNPNTDYDLDQYNIYRDLSSPAVTLIDSVTSASPPDTFYIDTEPIIGQDYYYRITAKDTAGNESDFSNEVNIAIPYDLYSDSLALVALYNSTDGVNWTNNTNWLTGNLSTWYGITVYGGRVTEINLTDNNLTGAIPIEIANLTNLQDLDLSFNQLSGSIPSEIGNLTNLTNLILFENNLSGSIPTEIGNLINLTSLNIHSNNLSGSIPPEIGNLINLTYLDLFINQLTGSIPPEIGNLTNLTVLYLFGNQLTGSIPTEIGNLVNLEELYLQNSQLTGSIPAEIGNLTSLIRLYLYNNQLSGTIPIEIVNLINLNGLDLSANQLTGPIPNEIVNLTNLSGLYINNNQFKDLPDLSSLALNDLVIQNNRFTFKDIEPNIGVASNTFTYSPQDSVGEIIDTTVYAGTSYTMSVSTGGASSQYQWKKDGANIGSISADSTYTINPIAFSDSGTYTCEITNTVATELTLYSRPINVFVDYSPLQKDSLALVALYNSTDGANWTDNTNWLIGNLSTWYGITVYGGRVTQINLINNNLVGTIPTEIGNLTNLTTLILFDNNLSGSIPTEIGNLINLTDLNIHCNNLSGSVPVEIGNLFNLTYLDLFINQLTGSIPSEIGNLTNLTILYLFSNQLSGSVPIEIGNLSNLTDLDFHDNQLTGSIPPEIGNLINLKFLDFSSNQLTGSIPAEIGNLTNLQQGLSLWNNQLTGTIPAGIGNLTNLRNLELWGNQLSGSIPTAICNLTYLKTFCLHNNQFTDLPDLSSLTSLAELKIQNNRFTFEDIEPNIGVASTEFIYSPQDSVGTETDTTIYAGTKFHMYVSVGGDNNQYQWRKDGISLGIQDSPDFFLDPVQYTDTGDYTCDITNTVATDLTLYSRPLHVSVDALHVSTTGDDSNPGTSGEPLRNIQTAMSVAESGAWIKVAAGTYTEGLVSQKRVTLLGGYNYSFLESQRNIAFYKTIIRAVSTVILTDNHGCTIDGFIFDGNNVAEIGLDLRAAAIISHNVITNVNQGFGDGVEIDGEVDFINNTLYNNNQGIEISSEDAVVNNNIIVNHDFGIDNFAADGIANYNCLYNNSFNYSGFYDTPGIGDLALNPEFRDAENGDFRLQSTSPCIDAGDPNVIYNDPDGSRNDMGAYYYEALSSEKEILNFSFPEQTGPAIIDYGNFLVDIEVNYMTDPSNLVATFTLSAFASATVNSVTQESGVTANDFTNPVTYTIEAEDGSTQDWLVTVTVESPPSSEKNILTFSFPEQTGPATIDDVNHTVDIGVLYSADLTNLVATFTLSDGASATVNSVAQESGVTANDFTNSVTYTIEAEDGSTQDWVVTVTAASAPSSEKNIMTYSFTEQTGSPIIDDINHTVDIEVVYSADIKNLVATFTLSAGASATINSIPQESSVTANDFSNPVTYTITAENLTTQDWVVTVSVASTPSSEKNILTYSFAEQTWPASIDDINHTVDIEVEYGTDLTNLIAIFTLSGGATAEINSVLQESGVTVNNFTNTVTYTVTAEDATTQDWVVTVTIASVTIISDFPYIEDFESGSGDWITRGTNSSWQLGAPAGPTINSAASGSVAWVTNLTGDYNTNEISYVIGPVFNFSSVPYPQIELKVWWDCEGFYDGASLQYKRGNDPWKTLGRYFGDDRWYNVSYIYSMQQGFGLQQDDACGWSGDGEWGYGSNDWLSAYYALSQLGNRPLVRFRVVFTSNSEYQNDGFAFDDITISNDPTGIEEGREWLSDINVYPNPNTGTFMLTGRSPDKGSLMIHVVNLQGQVVFEKQITLFETLREELDLSFLSKGIYYLRLSAIDAVGVKKLIIQ